MRATDPDPTDSTYQVDYAYLVREADGEHRVVQDRHVEGLYPRATWLGLLAEVGFEARVALDPWARDVFVGRRPVLPRDPGGRLLDDTAGIRSIAAKRPVGRP